MPEVIAKKQIRGSGLLLFGRFLSLALNLITQVMIVRYLSKTDYGLFAYALAIVETIAALSRLGMEQTAARYVPIYEERNDQASAAGTIILAVGTIAALGCAIVALFVGFKSLLTDTFIDDTALINILIILIALVPVDALDTLLQELFAALGKPKIIFLRKYVIGPLLKLAAISLTIVASGDTQTLAISYVFAGLVSFLIYGVLMPKALRERKLTQYFRPGHFKIDSRRLFSFSLPVFSADSIAIIRLVLVIAVVEYFHGLSHVADYRAVLPIAHLNSVTLMIFSMLFYPMASRLFAQRNLALLGEIQSHVGLWVIVLSFPIFAVCISLAEPIIVLLIGERYATSASILTILALGHFLKSAFGLSPQSLRAMGYVRVLLYIEFVSTASLIIMAWLLVPKYGALGGAMASASALIFYGGFSTLVLWRVTGSNPLPWTYSKIYLLAALCAVGLWLSNSVLGIDSVLMSIVLVALSSLVVFASCWKLLRVTEMFPEAAVFLKPFRR